MYACWRKLSSFEFECYNDCNNKFYNTVDIACAQTIIVFVWCYNIIYIAIIISIDYNNNIISSTITQIPNV